MKFLKYTVVLPLCFSSVIAVQAASLDNDEKKFSYLQGYKAGKLVTAENPGFDIKSFNMAMEDALNGKDPKLSEEEIRATVQAVQQKNIANMKAAAEKTLKRGKRIWKLTRKRGCKKLHRVACSTKLLKKAVVKNQHQMTVLRFITVVL